MAYCKKCGAELAEGQKFCKECGNSVDELVEAKDNRTTDIVMGILAYIGILVLVPIFAAKDSKFARFHANQGLVLFIIEIAILVLQNIFVLIPILGWIINIALWVISVGTLVLSIIGIVNVAKYETKELPIVGGFQVLK